MSDSIKKQIMARIKANLLPLVTQGKIRKLARSIDILQVSDVHPSLFFWDGPEKMILQDNHGRTFRFSLGIKLELETQGNPGDAKDDLVPQIQKIMEADLQLGGLANTVEGGEEEPFVHELQKPLCGSVLPYEIEYRRALADPYTTY